MYISIHVKYSLFLSDFHKTQFYQQIFEKLRKYKISWKYVRSEPNFSMRTDSRKNRHD